MGATVTRFGLYVKFTARTGQRDVLIELLLEAAEGARDAPGCELYIVSMSPSEADTAWVTEVWSSQADHDASLSDEAARALIARALPLLAGPPERIETVPVGGKGLAGA
jgi:quinol monooxygenase YgiN